MPLLWHTPVVHSKLGDFSLNQLPLPYMKNGKTWELVPKNLTSSHIPRLLGNDCEFCEHQVRFCLSFLAMPWKDSLGKVKALAWFSSDHLIPSLQPSPITWPLYGTRSCSILLRAISISVYLYPMLLEGPLSQRLLVGCSLELWVWWVLSKSPSGARGWARISEHTSSVSQTTSLHSAPRTDTFISKFILQ